MAKHKVGIESYHYLWNNEHKPLMHIKSGDSVHFQVNEVTSWQITKDSRSDDLMKLDLSRLYPLAGPIYIDDVSEGDALSVEVEEIKTASWGWSGIIPGLGLLPEFSKPFIQIWDLSKQQESVDFKNEIKVPLAPFCGVMGVAPKEKGAFEVLPPGKHGGNMDIKHLIKGSKVTLPIWTKGALFSVGDLHAAMGDGEVCATAIECPGEVTLKFELVKDADVQSPRFVTSKKLDASPGDFFVTIGIAPDLLEASRLATRNMIDHLTKACGLDSKEAYILCSVSADLKIHEVVDMPNWLVGMWIPKTILGPQ